MRHNSLLSNIFKPKLWLSLALLLLFIFLLSRLSTVWHEKSSVDREIESIKNDASKMEASNSQFKKMIAYLESDQFAEEQAKLKLGLKKPGEQVMVVTGLDDATSTNATNSANLNPNADDRLGDNWQRWFDYFLLEK